MPAGRIGILATTRRPHGRISVPATDRFPVSFRGRGGSPSRPLRALPGLRTNDAMAGLLARRFGASGRLPGTGTVPVAFRPETLGLQLRVQPRNCTEFPLAARAGSNHLEPLYGTLTNGQARTRERIEIPRFRMRAREHARRAFRAVSARGNVGSGRPAAVGTTDGPQTSRTSGSAAARGPAVRPERPSRSATGPGRRTAGPGGLRFRAGASVRAGVRRAVRGRASRPVTTILRRSMPGRSFARNPPEPTTRSPESEPPDVGGPVGIRVRKPCRHCRNSVPERLARVDLPGRAFRPGRAVGGKPSPLGDSRGMPLRNLAGAGAPRSVLPAPPRCCPRSRPAGVPERWAGLGFGPGRPRSSTRFLPRAPEGPRAALAGRTS